MKVLIIIFAVLMSLTQLYSQPENLESNYSRYTAFAVDDDNFYIGLENGFVVQDRVTGGYEYYSTLNTDMLSNNITDIEVYQNKVYFISDSLVYIYNNKALNIFDLENEKITGLYKDKNDLLWFSGDDVLISYDGTSTKEIDITKQVEEYGKLDSFVFDDNFMWLTFGYFNNRLNYALYDFSNNIIRSISQEERPFGNEYSKVMTFSDSVVWIKANNRIYSYKISSNKWEKPEVFLFPKNIELKSNLVADNNGIIWFAILLKDSNGNNCYVANYDGVSDSINVLYDYKFDGELSVFNFFLFGSNIIFSKKGSYNSIINNNIIEIVKYEDNDILLKSSNFYEYKGGLYRLEVRDKNNETIFKFTNLMNEDYILYTIIEDKYFPLSNIGSYFLVHGTEFISSNYNSLSFMKLDQTWQEISELGYSFKGGNRVEIEANEEMIIYSDAVYKYDHNGISKLLDYKANSYRGVGNFQDKFYFYGSYPIGNHYDIHNFNKIYGTMINVFDNDGNKLLTLDEDNTCMSRYYENGKYNTYFDGPMPRDLKIDNNGNIWCLTTGSLFYIDQNIECTRFKFDDEGNNPKPSNIAYSKFQGKMYGRRDNTVYDLSDTNYRKNNSDEMVDGDLNFIGECNDGLVYVATTDGRLFKLNSLVSWENIPLIDGKEKIHVSIRNVFRSEDTLYVSTEIGLIKVHQKVTSVENTDYINDFKIYPNPTQDYINIDPQYINEIIEIRTLTGKLVLESKGTEIIDVNELTPGVYLVKCGDRITKFIKD